MNSAHNAVGAVLRRVLLGALHTAHPVVFYPLGEVGRLLVGLLLLAFRELAGLRDTFVGKAEVKAGAVKLLCHIALNRGFGGCFLYGVRGGRNHFEFYYPHPGVGLPRIGTVYAIPQGFV
jgi:hypothetical protein